MDSREPQQYRLKPGIDLRITDLKDGLSFVHYQDDYVQWETEHVNALFETVDIDAIRKQIFEDKELFRIASLIGCDGEDWQIERRKNNLVDYVFSLITGVTLGRKQ